MDRKVRLIGVALFGSVLLLSACGGSTTSTPAASEAAAPAASEAAAPAEAEWNKKVAYIPKRMDQGWFGNEVSGVQSVADANGMEVVVLDSQFDAAIQASNLDTAYAQGVGGILLITQDQKLGPQILAQAKEKGTMVIAIDDPIVDSDGNPAPFVGMNTKQIGDGVGELLAEAVKAKGWAVKDLGLGGLTFNEVQPCVDRTEGTKAALFRIFPDLQQSQVYETNYEGANTDGGLQAMQGLITSHPEVKHWLVYSCNEEGVTGGIRALEAAGKDKDSCGVGIGDGALAKIEFKKGTPAYCGNLFANSALHGSTAMTLMLEYLKNGTVPPVETLVDGIRVTPENYEEVFYK